MSSIRETCGIYRRGGFRLVSRFGVKDPPAHGVSSGPHGRKAVILVPMYFRRCARLVMMSGVFHSRAANASVRGWRTFTSAATRRTWRRSVAMGGPDIGSDRSGLPHYALPRLERLQRDPGDRARGQRPLPIGCIASPFNDRAASSHGPRGVLPVRTVFQRRTVSRRETTVGDPRKPRSVASKSSPVSSNVTTPGRLTARPDGGMHR